MLCELKQRQFGISEFKLINAISKNPQTSISRVFFACKQTLNQRFTHLWRYFNVTIPIKPTTTQRIRYAKDFAFQGKNRTGLIGFVLRAKILSNIHNNTPYIFTSYLLNWVCGGFERSVLGKYSPNPVSNKVSEYHADGNRYRYMGPASTHGLTMAVTVSRTPVSGLPSLLRGHSYQLGLKQFPVALSRSYGGDRSSCASYRFRLGSESHLTHSKLWSVIRAANKKATYCCSRLRYPGVLGSEA